MADDSIGGRELSSRLTTFIDGRPAERADTDCAREEIDKSINNIQREGASTRGMQAGSSPVKERERERERG